MCSLARLASISGAYRMAEKRRIGLRDIRGLKPGEPIWDASISGFSARAQMGDVVSFVVAYCNARGGGVG